MIIFFYFITGIIVLAIIMYLSGYAYLFNGISKTYLRGKSSANIDDGKLFSSNLIATKTPELWEEAQEYNKSTLPKNIVDDLTQSNTASFLVVKDGKLVHEQYWNGYNQLSKTNSFSGKSSHCNAFRKGSGRR
jgi:hypothetical protein